MKTVAAELWGTLPPVDNHRTLAYPQQRPRRDLRDLFVGAYGMFAARCRAIDEPGLAVVGIEEATGRPAGVMTLLARVQRYVAAIVGRHDACDLFLHGCADLALRQLAIVLDPVHDWAPRSTQIRFRALDLRTQYGFRDEHGKPLRGLRCEGPAILRCGGFALFALPLGDPNDWPTSASDAWSMLPDRVYLDELEADARGSMPIPAQVRSFAGGLGNDGLSSVPPTGPFTPQPLAHPEAPQRIVAKGTSIKSASLRSSVIMRVHGPRDTGESFARSGDRAGVLEITGRAQRGTLTLSESALRDGVLLGRYARCDGAGLLDDPSLSRVHGLLLRVEDALLYIDTASRNGTRWSDGGEVRDAQRLYVLGEHTELRLGSATRARWRWSD